MKRIIIFFATMAIALSAHAQTDSLVTVDTKGDGLNFNIAGFSVKLEGKNEHKKKQALQYQHPGRQMGSDKADRLPLLWRLGWLG